MKYILLIYSFLFMVFSCQDRTDYSIPIKSDKQLNGRIQFSKDESCYFYDLKIIDNFYLFLDERSDTVLRVYKQGNTSYPYENLCRSSEKDKLWMPSFTKEIHNNLKDTKITFLVDNNQYYKSITLNNNIKINISKLLDLKNMFCRDFNITSKEIYATPVSRYNKNPYFFFNPDSGYYWVDPSSSIEEIMPKDNLSYTNTICLNESQNTIVSAYRFTNYVSFYGLDGTLKTTVKFGETPVIPIVNPDRDEIDIRNTPKCFTYICGTPQYVYCLYDGSSDFTAPSKIVIFQWNGKHIATCQADRNLQAIAVDKDDKYILAIASNYNGQDIIKYHLE